MLEPAPIYEDSNLLVLNKPAGWLVHGAPRSGSPIVVAWLKARYCAGWQVGSDPERSGIVHRLDRDTSGLLIVAKTDAALEYLKRQFHDRLIKKTYLSLVYGEVKNQIGIIDLPIGRSRRHPSQRSAGPAASGRLRAAVTKYRRLETWPGYSWLELAPQTGRTHQLRVHLKALGHSIVCDHLYAPGRPCLPGLGRQALHAWRLELASPSGERLALEAELPADIEAALAALDSLNKA
ncbi:MAG: RluA family pseudouridine synthase [Patescibacteria group bacterium]